jgi:hypothetical protein
MDRRLGLVHRRLHPMAVQGQEGSHGRMPETLVAVDEGVVLDEGEPEDGGLCAERWIELFPGEGLSGGARAASNPPRRASPTAPPEEATSRASR